MNKREFLNELTNRLDYMDKNERIDIINYYDELIEDGIENGRRESDVIYDLGDIDSIVKRVDPNNKNRINEETNEKIYYDEVSERKEERREKDTVNNNKSDADYRLLIGILIAIFTFPVWFGLLIGLICGLIGIIVGAIAIGVVGVTCTFIGFANMATAFSSGLFLSGAGLLLLGLDVLIIPLIIKLIKWLIKMVIKFVKWLCGALKRKETA